MSFGVAMTNLLQGARVRRKDWNRPRYIELRQIVGLTNPIVVMVMADGTVGPYTPSGCDMVASDWYAAEEAK